MKVLIISSSPRRGGNSDVLCDEFSRGATEAGHEVEKIFLKDKKIAYCTGCNFCYDTHRCSQRDDMGDLIEKMIAADVIVLASPIYFYTMCGQMKVFIDRCCAGYTQMTGKDFYYILTAAESSKAAVERAVTEFGGFLACLENPTHRGTIYGTGAWKVGEIKSTPAMAEAYAMGKGIGSGSTR